MTHISLPAASELPAELHTRRLKLRRWMSEDLELFARMNADPVVMEFFPSVLTREQSDASAARSMQYFEKHGFGPWVVEIPGEVSFAGFIGLWTPRFEAHFTPCIEIGWRLAQPYWGRGFATEGARAALEFAFGTLHLDEVVSMTAVVNHRSRRVMEKLGMTCASEDDFSHPLVPAEHILCRHVLYRARRRA